MIKQFFLSYTLFSLIFFSYSTNFEELFLQGNIFYKEGKYKEALEVYSSIEPKGWGTWYNIGLCWHALNDPLQALIAWKKSQKNGGFYDEPLRHAIKEVQQQLNIPPPSSSLWQQARHVLVYPLSLSVWQILFLCMWFIFHLSIWNYVRQPRRIKNLLIVFGIAVLLLITTLGVWIKYKEKNLVYGIILNDIAAVAGKNEKFKVVFELKKGEAVPIIVHENEWDKVYKNGNYGWIQTTHITPI